MDKTLKLRVEAAELDSWRKQAEESGETLSSWIRRKCGEQPAANSEMSESRKVRVGRGRTNADRVPAREAVRTDTSDTQTAEELVSDSEYTALDYEVARRTNHAPGCNCAWECSKARRTLSGGQVGAKLPITEVKRVAANQPAPTILACGHEAEPGFHGKLCRTWGCENYAFKR